LKVLRNNFQIIIDVISANTVTDIIYILRKHISPSEDLIIWKIHIFRKALDEGLSLFIRKI